MIRSGNPALSDAVFVTGVGPREDAMTLQGTVGKTALLGLFVMVGAVPIWNLHFSGAPVGLFVLGGAIVGLVLALATVWKRTWAPVTAPLYALAEGLFLGGISAFAETLYPGIVIQAVFLTFGTLFALLAAYSSRLIQPSENFKLGLAAATGGIFLVYMASMLLRLFGLSMPYLHEGGPIGIGFSLVVVVIAALNLVMDFDFIERGAERGAPRHMEWFGAFGLVVTLVWLYIEILHLLMKLQERR